MEPNFAFSPLLPTISTHKKSEAFTESDVVEEASLESYSSSPLLAAFRKGICGWKAGLRTGIVADTVIFVTVLIFTFVAAFSFQREGSQAILINGSCSKTKSYSIWLHLLINVFSTILLASGSYATQCVISPTEKDLRKVHAIGQYMNIGAPSIRNLFHIPRYRSLLFVIAALSSLPIHLFANSVIFETLGTDSYIMVVAYEQFLTAPPSAGDTSVSYRYLQSYHSDRTWYGGYPGGQGGNPSEDVALETNLARGLRAILPNMKRLENEECIRTYSQNLVSGWRHVIAITPDVPPPQSENYTYYLEQPFYQSVDICPECQTYLNYTDPTIWTCSFTEKALNARGCDSSLAASRAKDFQISEITIAYCMAEPVPEKCQLRADIGISSFLLGFTFVKICVLLAVISKLPKDTIATLGDAISCFLKRPEAITRGSCLLERGDVHRRRTDKQKQASLPYHLLDHQWTPGKPFHKHWSTASLSRRWSSGPRIRAWASVLLVLGTILVISVAYLGMGIEKLKQNSGLQDVDLSGSGNAPHNAAALWRIGFGAVNINFLLHLSDITSEGGLIGRVLLVNTPQLLLSIFYFTYNSVWTHMLLAREWAQFGNKRQSLRVSGNPIGQQRSNYFLSIPYQAAVPLQVVSALLHWLLSQSFFLARINVYSGVPFVNKPMSVINTVGYSLIALIFLISLWGILLIAVVVAGSVGRLRSPIPMVGANSLAISAACHPPSVTEDISTRPLMWGVVSGMEEDGIKHCSFSADEVYSPAHLVVPNEKGFVTRTSALFG